MATFFETLKKKTVILEDAVFLKRHISDQLNVEGKTFWHKNFITKEMGEQESIDSCLLSLSATKLFSSTISEFLDGMALGQLSLVIGHCYSVIDD